MWIVPVVLAAAAFGVVDYENLGAIAFGLLVTVVTTSLLVGVGEELMFRGITIQALRDNGMSEHRVALWSSVIFGGVHITNLFTEGPQAIGSADRLGVGVLLLPGVSGVGDDRRPDASPCAVGLLAVLPQRRRGRPIAVGPTVAAAGRQHHPGRDPVLPARQDRAGTCDSPGVHRRGSELRYATLTLVAKVTAGDSRRRSMSDLFAIGHFDHGWVPRYGSPDDMSDRCRSP